MKQRRQPSARYSLVVGPLVWRVNYTLGAVTRTTAASALLSRNERLAVQKPGPSSHVGSESSWLRRTSASWVCTTLASACTITSRSAYPTSGKNASAPCSHAFSIFARALSPQRTIAPSSVRLSMSPSWLTWTGRPLMECSRLLRVRLSTARLPSCEGLSFPLSSLSEQASGFRGSPPLRERHLLQPCRRCRPRLHDLAAELSGGVTRARRAPTTPA
mmetsp:Transcript_35972/g.94624  ORF Transcript_35972/g.94624 Transcript_35972/m.94624 type:complete len:217 (+) Transcript_35972:1942-2592(+)